VEAESNGSIVPPPAGAGSLAFPTDVVAPVVIPTKEPARAISGLYVTPGATRNSSQVVVRFRDPFDLPRQQYRISVLMGDPNGFRVRSSLTTNGGPKPEGKVERWDGNAFQWSSTAEVSFDRSGLAAVGVPIDTAPAGAVWVEVEVGTGGEVTRTPLFSQDPLFGRVTNGTLQASSYGRLVKADGSVSPDVVVLDSGASLTSINSGATLITAAAAPVEFAGHKVTHAVDIVQLAPDFNGASALADEIRIDRTEGKVSLLQRRSQPPVDKSGAEGWLVGGLVQGDPGAPVTMTFDLRAAAAGVESDLGDGSAMGLRRELTLDDGSTVVASGYLATRSWFDRGALASANTADTPAFTAPQGPLTTGEEGSTSAQQRNVAVIAGAVAGIMLLLSVIVMVRRRRLTSVARPAAVGVVALDPERAAEARAKDEARRRKRKNADAADLLQDMAEDMDQLRRTGQIAAVTGSIPAVGAVPSTEGTPSAGRATNHAFAPITGQQPVVVLSGEIPAMRVPPQFTNLAATPKPAGAPSVPDVPDLPAGPAPAAGPAAGASDHHSTEVPAIVTLEDLHARTIANAEASLAGGGTGSISAVAAGAGAEGDSPPSRSPRPARPTRAGRSKRPAEGAGPTGSTTATTASPAPAPAPDPLGLLDSDLSDLAARLDRLGATSGGGPVTPPSVPAATTPAVAPLGDSPA